jgi:small subunit ribosomal protein S17
VADEKKTETKPEAEETPEMVSEETVEEVTEPEPEAEAEEPAEESQGPVAEEEGPSEEPPAEEPAAEAEAPAEEPPAEEPAAEEEAPAEEPPAEEPAAEAAPVPAEEAAPAQPERKPKRKRLPRAQRHKHVKPKRERPAQRSPIVRLPKPEHVRGRRQERRGVVVSDAMDKTIVVKVDTVKAHRKYKKVVRRSTRFHAHDEQNAAKVGDLVRIVETRPLSKTKNWRLAEVLEEAK